MMKKSDVARTLVGVSAVLLSGYLLYHEVRNISLTELADSLRAIGARGWLLAALSTLGAYVALAWYDRIAMAHLGKTISCGSSRSARSPPMRWRTTSARVLRRAGALSGVSQQGLTPQEIGILIVFCSLTFTLGTLLAAGVADPRSSCSIAPKFSAGCVHGHRLRVAGADRTLRFRCVAPVAAPAAGQWHSVSAPADRRSAAAGRPAGLLCAAAIIYFALPTEHNPGYLTVLGVFLASFSLALLSHAPGGLGVLELTFLSALPEVPKVDVLAALIVFRGFYAAAVRPAMVVVLVFEFDQWRNRRREAPIR